MKRNIRHSIWLMVVATLVSNVLFSQAELTYNTKKVAQKIQVVVPVQGKASGLLLDEKKHPIPFATVKIKKALDSAFVKGVSTSTDGIFTVESLPANQYFISVSVIGYQSTNVAFNIDEQNTEIKLSPIEMKVDSKLLNEVVVKSQKQLFEQKVDRLVFNVEGSGLAAGNNTLELLAKAPMIYFNAANESLLLKGRVGVKIMIDGKLTNLSESDANALLKSMPADEIAKIEIITNPSAKYDAAGTAGLINIITKKGQSLGTNGSFSVGGGYSSWYHNDDYGRGNISLTLNHRTEKVNIYGSLSASSNRSFSQNTGFDEYYDLTNTKLAYKHENQNLLTYRSNSQSFKIGVDWFVNPKTTIGFLTNGFMSSRKDHDDALTLIFKEGKTLEFSNVNTQDESSNNNRLNFNTNIKHIFDAKSGREITADFDYSSFGRQAYNDINNYLRTNEGKLYNPLLLRNSLPINVDIVAGKIDYVHPISEKSKFETGIKISNVVTDNNAQFEINNNSVWENDTSRTNHFKYSERINAGYINYSTGFGKYELQLGLRAEQTISSGNSITTNTIVDRNYTEFFPSFFLTNTLNDNHTLGISYSRRIGRPSYEDLNPFIVISDRYSYHQGNPFLKPSFTSAIELTHTFKGTFTTSLTYENMVDLPLEVMRRESTNNRIVLNRMENIASGNFYAINFSFSKNITKWWSVDSYTGGYYGKYKTTLQGQEITNGQPYYMINVQNSFTLPKNWTYRLSGNYLSSLAYGVMTQNSQYQVDMGFSKSLWQKIGTLKISFDDIFRTARGYYTSRLPGLASSSINRWQSQILRVSFTYKFGSSKIKAARRRSTVTEDEQGRVNIKD
jgi:outer membrane receptor protein involved in Fe transport